MARTTTLEERIRIHELAQQGHTDAHIAQTMNLAVPTIRKWRRRAAQGGRPALVSAMGRPRQGALAQFPEAVRARLLTWRKNHPGWGAKTLQTELATTNVTTIPSQATIGRLLKAEGLTRAYRQHSALPQVVLKQVTKAHQCWQLDAKGNDAVEDLGTISLLDLSDVFSRARLLSYPCWLQGPSSHPTTEDYKTALRLAFTQWGMPDAIQVDHESIFFDNHSVSPYPTALHLWLEALGIDLVFSRYYRATDQAIVERSHTLWYKQVVAGQRFSTWSALYEALLRRRDFLNAKLPSAYHGQRPILEAVPEARHSGRFYRPCDEARLLCGDRLATYLGQGRWFRRVSNHGTVSLGGSVYYVGRAHSRADVEIRLHPTTWHWLFYDALGQVIAVRPVRGLPTQAGLAQERPYVSVPGFQLSIGFTWTDQARIRLNEHRAGMT